MEFLICSKENTQSELLNSVRAFRSSRPATNSPRNQLFSSRMARDCSVSTNDRLSPDSSGPGFHVAHARIRVQTIGRDAKALPAQSDVVVSSVLSPQWFTPSHSRSMEMQKSF